MQSSIPRIQCRMSLLLQEACVRCLDEMEQGHWGRDEDAGRVWAADVAA